MVENSHFMGQDGFVWFVGVVEDRIDPSALGRVRVRCLGYHTASVIDLPTTDLPWAHVMHPVTDPSMHGMGNTPSFLVEGSYVVGFFRDVEKQQLVIMGTLPGIPEEEANPKLGFNDPRGSNAVQEHFKGDPVYGPYPVDGEIYTMPSGHEIGEPDTNRLAQGEQSEIHEALIARRAQRLSGDPAGGPGGGTGIPTATQPYIPSVSDEPIKETRGYFDEPHPKGLESNAQPYTSAAYPYNHVFESESGHIREVDDSPGAERLFTQHKSGTFEEIHTDGTKVVKVIGDNYEIIAGGSNVYIVGDVNITTQGTVREYIKGDYHLEVEGNYTQKIHKNLRTRVGASGSGNLEEEIMGNHAFNINGYVKGNVGPLDGSAAPGEGDVDINIVGNETHIVGNNLTLHAQADTLFTADNNMLLTATASMNVVTTSGIMSIKSGSYLDIRAKSDLTIKTEANMNMTTSGIKKEVVTGAAHETFSSTYYVDYKGENHFTHSGIQWYMRGADYHARHEAGVDYACSSDTSRTSANDCTDLTLPTSP